MILAMWAVGIEYWIAYSDTVVHAASGITVAAMVLLALAAYPVGLAAYRVGLVVMRGPSRSERNAKWGLLGLCVACWFLLAWTVIDAIPRFQSMQVALILVADIWPVGILCVSLAALTFCLFRRDRRDRRAVQSGHCTTCGYDLRASEKRCPECGKAFWRAGALPAVRI